MNDLNNLTATKWCENEEHYLGLLENESVRNAIPFLNINKPDKIKNGDLVRFNGMIQNMHSPEYYLEKLEVTNRSTNEKRFIHQKYNEDDIELGDLCYNLNSDRNVTSERQTFVVITIPAVNSWVFDVYKQYKLNTSMVANNKRSYDEMEVDNPSTSTLSGEKRICMDVKSNNGGVLVNNNPKDIFPLENDFNVVYNIKIYKDYEQLKINDVCEFIGFLDTKNEDNDSYGSYPKIQCVFYKKLKHINPLVTSIDKNLNISTLRQDLLIVLTQLLLGDELAAEYLLYHLLSEVYLRRNGLALGKFSLNVSNIPTINNLSYTNELYKFIEMLIPKSIYLPMTLENLNDLTFIPKKNYDLNYLVSGILQLSNNTHLILDETKLSPGKLNECGINNVKALNGCVKNQSVEYDFKYYPLNIECDLPVLILSEGKSMISSDVHVKLEADKTCVDTCKEIFEAAQFYLKPDLLNNIRRYLTMARMIQYELSDDVEKFVQDEFVKMRKDKNVTGDDLHRMLVLTRLVSISYGNCRLNEEMWRKAFQLEEKRKGRFIN